MSYFYDYKIIIILIKITIHSIFSLLHAPPLPTPWGHSTLEYDPVLLPAVTFHSTGFDRDKHQPNGKSNFVAGRVGRVWKRARDLLEEVQNILNLFPVWEVCLNNLSLLWIAERCALSNPHFYNLTWILRQNVVSKTFPRQSSEIQSSNHSPSAVVAGSV